jgi:hypothetical protein
MIDWRGENSAEQDCHLARVKVKRREFYLMHAKCPVKLKFSCQLRAF